MRILAAVGFACVLSGAAAAQSLPDPAKTPGAVRSTDVHEICAPEYARSHRVWHDQRLTFQRYGLPYFWHEQYEDDDLVPVCLGGDNASPLNHWPQPIAEAHAKDHLEAEACRAVCAGERDLQATQRWFMQGGWAH